MGTTNTAQQFEALFDNAAIGIIITNEQGEIIMINGFALLQFGYEEKELLGQKIEILLPHRFRQVHAQHRNNYHGQGAHNRPMGMGLDLYALKKNNFEFPVEVSLSVYAVNGKQYVISFINDITVRKKAEDDLIRLNEALEEKVKERTYSLQTALEKEKELNELKSRFVSMASHEFRTPLSTILSSAYLVTKYQTEAEQQKREKHIQRIVSSVNTLTDILNDFLSVGRIEEGKIQMRYIEFSIPDLINALMSEMQSMQKSGQKVQYRHKGEPRIILDATLLKHIVMNLLSNALKFSPEQSTITINTENTNDLFTLAIKDEGVGISQEDQLHLFERFFRGENVINIQGTGLGLHIVSKYAELMNGSIVCNSRLNEGTEFKITIKKR